MAHPPVDLPARIARWVVMVTGALALSSCGSCAATAHEALTGQPEWSIAPLTATFDQSCFCTKYQDAIALTGTKELDISFLERWTITLALVDGAGLPFPGDPGSGAAVDAGCSNAGNGTTKAVTNLFSIIEDSSRDVSFTWYHPAAADTPPGQPAGVYKCDHLKQGPRGHQGIVTLEVLGAGEDCTVSYRGTISGSGSDAGQPGVMSCRAIPSSTPTPA